MKSQIKASKCPPSSGIRRTNFPYSCIYMKQRFSLSFSLANVTSTNNTVITQVSTVKCIFYWNILCLKFLGICFIYFCHSQMFWWSSNSFNRCIKHSLLFWKTIEKSCHIGSSVSAIVDLTLHDYILLASSFQFHLWCLFPSATDCLMDLVKTADHLTTHQPPLF